MLAALLCVPGLAGLGELRAEPLETAPTLHVSPQGDDRWSGRQAEAGQRPGDTSGAAGGDVPDPTQGPLRTLAEAQRRARQLLLTRRQALADAPAPAAGAAYAVRVLLHPGRYELQEPLRFNPADSGLPGRPMVYQAAVPGTVTLSGGRLLPRAAADPGAAPDPGSAGDTVWHYSLPAPDSLAGQRLDTAFWASGPQLYVDGQRAVLAREPDAGRHWYAGTPVAVPDEPAQALGHQAFRAQPEALAFVQALPAAERQRALLHVMQSWTSGRHRLASGAPADSLRVTPRSRWPFLFFGASQRTYIENVEAAFDAPGEWLGGPEGVRLRPRPGQAAPAHALLPVLQQLVLVQGTGPAGPYVEHLRLQGLDFEATHEPTPPGGWADNQAVLERGAAIEVDFARHFVLQNCGLRRLGAHAVWLREGVRDSRVQACTMQDLGAGGVKIGTAAPSGPATQHTGANQLLHNLISHTGRHWPGAVGVWVGPSFDNTIAHNTISHTSYTGISLGWSWGDRPPESGRNRVHDNALLHIGQGTLADLGAVYTLGPSQGTVIERNLIFDVRGYCGHGAGAWGLYTDEGSQGLVLRDNVVIGTDGGGYHLHYGRDLLLQDNLLAGGRDAEVSVTRSDPGRTRLRLQGNLLFSATARPFAGFARAPDAQYQGNAVAPWLAGGQPPLPDLAACAGGCVRSAARLVAGDGPQTLQVEGLPADDDTVAGLQGAPTRAQAQRWAAVAATAGAGAVLPAARQAPVWDTAAWARALGAGEKADAATVAGAAAMVSAPGSATAGQTAASSATPPGPVASPQALPAQTGADEAPALSLGFDLQTLPWGARPPGWRMLPAQPAEALAVVHDPTAPGGRCLQVSDSARFRFPFEPYFHHPLNHGQGRSRVDFALRVDSSVQITHEWRDAAQPYRSGPSLRISAAGGVQAGGRRIAPAPAGRWLQVQVDSPLGGAPAPWQVRVTDDQGRVHDSGPLPPRSPGWQRLEWLGFIADGTVPGVACIADVRAENLR